jgi:predicted kinase
MGGRVYVFFGMIATGKSSLARVWADQQGCLYLNSDVVRKELAGVMKESRVPAALDDGIYAPAFTQRTYDELLRRSEMVLANDADCCIVLDASYQFVDERIRLRRIFGGRCRLQFIYCTCSDETVKKRLAIRALDQNAVSDGRWEIYLRQKQRYNLPDELPAGQLIWMNTERSLEELLPILEMKLLEAEARQN